MLEVPCEVKGGLQDSMLSAGFASIVLGAFFVDLANSFIIR